VIVTSKIGIGVGIEWRLIKGDSNHSEILPDLLFKPPKACELSQGKPALKARRSKAQGGGREAAVTLGGHEKDTSPEGAAQSASPLQGFCYILFVTQGSRARFACSFTLGSAAGPFQGPYWIPKLSAIRYRPRPPNN